MHSIRLENSSYARKLLYRDANMSFINKALQGGVAILIACTLFKLFIAPPSSIIHEPRGTYDFIIVGAGSAGSVLASRLSEHYQVLLIEAGGQFGWTARVPIGAPFLQGTEYDWQYKTVSQEYSSHGLVENVSFWPRGKGLGGSGQLNFLVHYGGRKEDWVEMAKAGVEGWGISTMSNYIAKLKGKSYRNERIDFTAAACQEDKMVECSASHCHMNATKLFLDRPLRLTSRHPTPLTTPLTPVLRDKQRIHLIKIDSKECPLLKALHGASQELKHLRLLVSAGESTVRRGNRYTSLQSHLQPALNREKLHVLLNSQVEKLEIKNRHVRGVEYTTKGIKNKVLARHEVILSAGTIGTPQILQISGVGPKDLLDRLGIDVVEDIPVGENLHDHFNVPIYVSLQKPVSITISKILRLSQVVRYLIFGKGHLAHSGVIGTVSSGDAGILLFGMGSTEEKLFRVISNYKQQVFNAVFPDHRNHSAEGIVFLTTCLRPKSRGWVRIRSAEVSKHPDINPNYLHDPYDMECTKKAIRLVRRLILTKPFHDLGARMQLAILDECLEFEPNVMDDSYLECLIRTTGISSYHPAGTASMGNLTHSILDNVFRLKTLTGLRVVDTSALPIPLLGAPHSVMLAMAERAANFILAQADAGLNQGQGSKNPT